MLINCVECELQISDKAIYCPHCGYPLKPGKRPYRKKKRARLPNGFGQISEIKDRNLKNPFRAMVSVGTKANGRPETKVLGYFKTYNNAYEALVEYHKSPYDFPTTMTCDELFRMWFKEYKEENLSYTTYNITENAWKYCSSVHTLPVKDLKIRHIRYCVEEGFYSDNGVVVTPNSQTRIRIKSVFNFMLDYAVNHELIQSNPARNYKISRQLVKEAGTHTHHEAFSASELDALWGKRKSTMRDIVLVQCYSGWRPNEVLGLKFSNITDGIMTGGSKTDAGRNRKVPIHPAIRVIVEKRLKQALKDGSETLFYEWCEEGPAPIKYQELNRYYTKLNNHRPHDGRKTFVTLAKKYNVDEYAIKYLVGHKISDLTERVYTDREFVWLEEEIRKIKGPEKLPGSC